MTENHAPVISARGLTKRYGGAGAGSETVLDNLDFVAQQGEVTAIVGPSGSGKSTLLAAVSGLLKPDQGVVSVLGQNLLDMDRPALTAFRLQSCGFIFQGFNLFPSLRAIDQVALVLKYCGLRRTDAVDRAYEALAEVGLEKKARLRPAQMSGGEKQRVAIARALAKSPKIIFADEPTSALDSENGEKVGASLRKAATSRGAAVIMVTHDAKMEAYAHRVLHMKDGRFLNANEPLQPV